jgi:ABC-type hemin transport system ATPase subunit
MARSRGRHGTEAGVVADRLIERFDVSEFRDRLVKQSPGGERRRVDYQLGTRPAS